MSRVALDHVSRWQTSCCRSISHSTKEGCSHRMALQIALRIPQQAPFPPRWRVWSWCCSVNGRVFSSGTRGTIHAAHGVGTSTLAQVEPSTPRLIPPQLSSDNTPNPCNDNDNDSNIDRFIRTFHDNRNGSYWTIMDVYPFRYLVHVDSVDRLGSQTNMTHETKVSGNEQYWYWY